MKHAILVGLVSGLLAACASPPRPGAVLMKAGPTEAHVALTAQDVRVGDKVNFYRDVEVDGGTKTARFEKKLLGEGKITRLMGDETAVVEVAEGVEFREGDYVARK